MLKEIKTPNNLNQEQIQEKNKIGKVQNGYSFHLELAKVKQMQKQLMSMMMELKGSWKNAPKPLDLTQKVRSLDQEMLIQDILNQWG